LPRSASPPSPTAEAARTKPRTKKKPAGRAARKAGKPAPADGSLLAPDEIAELFARLKAIRPDPRSELEYTDPYTLLVSVVLSAQATDKSVNQATAALYPVADTPAQMVALGEAGLEPYLRTIGLYRAKTKNVIALSRILIAEHGGQVPRDAEALQRLPGVGRKTAKVVLNTAFGEKVIAVDTHIFRVSNRTGLAPGKTPEAVGDILEAVVPDEYKRDAHHWLILHGRYVCMARRPQCPVCPIADLCRYGAKTEAL
jgi:endonuclease-3